MTALKGDFEQDVPTEMHDDVLTRIVEAAWANDGSDEAISIIDRVDSNATNIEFNGAIMIGDVEHSFHIRDGNNAGTEIIAWNDDIEIKQEPRAIFAIVPEAYRINEAITSGAAVKLLHQWNRDLNENTERYAGISKVCSDLAYDLHFDPGLRVANRYRDKANHCGYEISDSEEAQHIRKGLLLTAFSLRPAGKWPTEEPGEAVETYEAWSQAKTPGSPIYDLLSRTADRLSKETGTSPDMAEIQEMRELGFQFTEPHKEYEAWKVGISSLYGIEDIEGFDPASLPEDPMKSLLHVFDPEIVSDLRVNPQHEAARCIDAMSSRMAREKSFKAMTGDADRLAVLGFRIVERQRSIEEEISL